MRIAIASVGWLPPQFDDDRRLAAALGELGAEATSHPWDEAAVDWSDYDLVVIRSTWDYTLRRDEFVAWADSIGDRLENPPAVIRWNSDKTYLADLAAAGLPVVETEYVAPGQPAPAIDREVVVKPAISGGGRDTGRFGPATGAEGRHLIEAIGSAGGTAMVQPFVDSVDTVGETAVVMIDGELSHVLRKGAVLRPDEVAPVRDDELGAAETMYDPDLVKTSVAEPDQLELASAVVAEVGERFGAAPLYARVDMLRDAAGDPVLLELEAVEPNLYFAEADGADRRLAAAIAARARA